MKSIRIFFISIILILAIALLIFFGLRLSKQDKSIIGTKVKMGLVGTPDILDIPYFIALEKGFYKEEGLDVEYISLRGDSIAIQALLAGSIDVTSSGHLSVIKAVAEHIPINAFVSIQKSHDYVLATPENINNIKQLKGKTIGIFATGDITETVTIGLLQKYGINRDEVKWLSIGGSTERYLSLLSGKVSAVPLHADLGYKIQKETGFHILISIADELRLPMSVVSATKEFIKESPQIVKGIAEALIKASRYASSDKEGFIEIALKYLEDIEREELSSVYDFLMNLSIYGVNGGINEESIENGINALVNQEELDDSLTARDVANFGFIFSVLNELGKF